MLALAEEDQLEAMWRATPVADVTCAVPPLGLITGMVEVVVRELVRLGRDGLEPQDGEEAAR